MDWFYVSSPHPLNRRDFHITKNPLSLGKMYPVKLPPTEVGGRQRVVKLVT